MSQKKIHRRERKTDSFYCRQNHVSTDLTDFCRDLFDVLDAFPRLDVMPIQFRILQFN